MTVDITKLHRYHAHGKATRLSFDLPGLTSLWRGEGGSSPLKTEIAHRAAVCWNVCEGIPTALLESGLLREMAAAVAAGDIVAAQAALAKIDVGTDTSDGRLHDCEGCMKRDEPQQEIA